MRVVCGACALSKAYAHGVWRMLVEYGACSWCMAHAHGVWRMHMECGERAENQNLNLATRVSRIRLSTVNFRVRVKIRIKVWVKITGYK